MEGDDVVAQSRGGGTESAAPAEEEGVEDRDL